jgi:hypothetical protein
VSLPDLKSAADEVLAILKTEEGTDAQRKTEIESILDRLSDEVFNQMTVLAQQFVDYAIEEEGGIQRGEEIIDVNVELDESEESGNEDEGDEEEDKRSDQGQEEAKLDIEEEDADIHQAVKREEEGVIDITDIDAQWLNRTLSGLFDDLMAEEVQELEGRLMKVLALENPP